MLVRALRGHLGAAPPVLLAGELEPAANDPESAVLSVSAQAASIALNGHGPARPAGLPGGALLAPLGLATRGVRATDGDRYPEVNLLGGGRATQQGRSAQAGTPAASSGPRRRLFVVAAVAGAVAVWSIAGVGVAFLLGHGP
jgi:hypothetical protein